MIPASFDYVRPTSLDEALDLVGKPGVKLIAGGQSLLPLMKLRLARPETLVDLNRIAELKGVRRLDDGRLVVGAATTYAELLDSEAMAYGVLRDAVPEIGDIQVRNLGTVGGAIAHCDPASDLPACLLALDVELLVRSRRGDRTISCDGFFKGAFMTALEEDEVVVEARLPAPREDVGSAFVSLAQPASGYSLVGVAAAVSRSGGSIGDARIAITGVGEAPYRARGVESALVGSDGSKDAIARAASHAADGIEVNSDIHADREYRTSMAAVYTRRAIEAALARLA
jgi:aerobic carbon-monoxide dehydrogenase medium subunit